MATGTTNVGFEAKCQIKRSSLKDMHLQPRILKDYDEQLLRTRKKAEVFTPACQRKRSREQNRCSACVRRSFCNIVLQVIDAPYRSGIKLGCQGQRWSWRIQ